VARHARPSLPRPALWPGRRGAWREYATFLGWAQAGPGTRVRVYAHLESLVLMFAAPQDGKTQVAAGQVIDAPGPVVATSVRADLLSATAVLRAERGRVDLWDPEGVSGLASTFRWNLVAGCQDMAVAVRRAGALVEAVAGKGRDTEAFWDDQASLVLGALLHAAALACGDMVSVHAWAGGDDDTPARILGMYPGMYPGASSAARDHLDRYHAMADGTRRSVAATLTRVLKFMQLPACEEAVTTADGSEGFDFAGFLRSTGTLYLVAGDSAVSPVPPLFACLVAELAHVARQLGRLDPPLTVILDEAGNIAPVPVAAWSSWAAGSGIRLHVIAQAWAQLVKRWGPEGAALIWQCCKTKVIFGGTSEDELAALTVRACGTARVRVTEPGPDGKRYRSEEMPLLTPAGLRMLPDGTAVVIQGRGAPVIVRLEQVRRRADYKRLRSRPVTAVLPAARPALPPARPWPPAIAEPALYPVPDELAAARARRPLPRPGEHDLPDEGSTL
jgi:type IV secretion system protein VirD4